MALKDVGLERVLQVVVGRAREAGRTGGGDLLSVDAPADVQQPGVGPA
jgi:hypothetical protein